MASGELGHDNLRRALQGFVDLLEFDMEDLPAIARLMQAIVARLPVPRVRRVSNTSLAVWESAGARRSPSIPLPLGDGVRRRITYFPLPLGDGVRRRITYFPLPLGEGGRRPGEGASQRRAGDNTRAGGAGHPHPGPLPEGEGEGEDWWAVSQREKLVGTLPESVGERQRGPDNRYKPPRIRGPSDARRLILASWKAV